MNVPKYLQRIRVAGPLEPDAATLALLQRRHLLSVPFENLDIHWKRPIALDTGKFYKKVVEEHRGGFCYELNGLFNELLKSLGFETRLISARVFNGTTHGPEFDHAAIIVTVGKDEYLTDVGFGDFATEPLRFAVGEEQTDPAGTFVTRRFDDTYFEVAKRAGDTWRSEYIFQDLPRELSEFTAMCDFQQYSPESHFMKGKICSLLTISGRKTITDKRLTIAVADARKETLVSSEEIFDRLLRKEFGIEMK